MCLSRICITAMASSLSLAAVGQADPGIQAPNVVAISENLVTAGQPTAGALAGLSRLGFKAVIYLAPPTVRDAIANESEILGQQGMAFVNIPIQFGKPTQADFEAFVTADVARRREAAGADRGALTLLVGQGWLADETEAGAP